MDVHSGTSLWQSMDCRQIKSDSLDHDLSCEVAIVGGGITGALVAYYLVEEGVDTVLLDKDQPAAASTAASTGLLQYEIDTSLCDLIGKVGEASAVQSYRLGLRAVDDIERLVHELSSHCGFARKVSLYLASSEAHLSDLHKEYECRASHGFDVSFLTAAELQDCGALKAPGAIRSIGDAQINPLEFTRELLHRAQVLGLRTYVDCQVQQMVPDVRGVLITTERAQISAQRVVVATGYAAQQTLQQDLSSLHTTYVIASKPLATFDGWPDQCLLWETARPYFYLRSTADGRAIVGGEDTPFSTDHQHDRLVADKAVQLQHRFAQIFPHLRFEPEFTWAGTFAETKDGLPYLGEAAELPNFYFALGYGGNGITFSMIAARIITDLFVRRPNPDAHIFRFDR